MGDSGLMFIGVMVGAMLCGLVLVIVAVVALLVTWSDKRRLHKRP